MLIKACPQCINRNVHLTPVITAHASVSSTLFRGDCRSAGTITPTRPALGSHANVQLRPRWYIRQNDLSRKVVRCSANRGWEP